MSLSTLRENLNRPNVSLSPSLGRVIKITANTIVATGIRPSIGDLVKIVGDTQESLGIVSAVEEKQFFINPFSFVEGHRSDDKVLSVNRGLTLPVGEAMLGRIVNPLGDPIDGKGDIPSTDSVPFMQAPIQAMRRGLIDEVFSVGVKSIDALLTCGKGQKMGIFAGSGVGKSTLMGMIVRGSAAPIKVVALIGERGREVPEFVKKNLNDDLTNTILIVATSDDSPLMRKYGAFAAMSIAEYFKSRGNDVMFIMDSVTRFAMAQREIGLALGEPPTRGGYPPSVLALLPQLMERAGKEEGVGSITAFFTVLVDGDDLSDPIADQSRSILDGHIVLNRDLTDQGIYPPISVPNSASRLINDITDKDQQNAVRKFRRLHAIYKENELLLRLNSYQKGSDKEIDEAIDKKVAMEDFLKQNVEEKWDFKRSKDELIKIMNG